MHGSAMYNRAVQKLIWHCSVFMQTVYIFLDEHDMSCPDLTIAEGLFPHHQYIPLYLLHYISEVYTID